MSAAGMALHSCLLLLLVAHGVSAVKGERHYLYHIHAVHFDPSQNTSVRYMERTAAVLFDGKQIVYYTDGKNLASIQLEKTWKTKARTKKDKRKVPNEFEGFNYLLDISHNDAQHFEQRRGCTIETTSDEDAILLRSMADYRRNGKIILYFSTDTGQWVAEDKKFLPVKMKWDRLPHLNHMTKIYLLQTCAERLLKYQQAISNNDILESEIVNFLINDDIAEPWVLQERSWSLSHFVFLSLFILMICGLCRRRKYSRCVFCSSSLAGVIHQALLCIKESVLNGTGEDEDDDDDDDDDQLKVLMAA